MNICMVGDYSANLDEGYKNASHYLAHWLERRHTVVRLNGKQVGQRPFWRSLGGARPDIIHTVAQPTDQSLILTHLLRQRCRKARTVISALRGDRYFPNGQTRLNHRLVMAIARPDLVLVQNADQEVLFKQLNCAIELLPNGVDLDRFHPATMEQRRALRTKYELDPDLPVVLHVGHLIPERNLPALERLPQAGIQVLVAGSLYMGRHHDLISRLEGAGFHVLQGYQPHVEELYMLSDLYVFPVRPGNSITMPLSVLEAMACNLRVLTARFSGLQHAFDEGGGFHFVDRTDDLLSSVQAALHSSTPVTTRQMVRLYSWPAIVDRLEGYYEGIPRR